LELREFLTGVVIGELIDPATVSFDRTIAKAFELDETEVVLIPTLRSEYVVFFA
jgi:hypothetical protein